VFRKATSACHALNGVQAELDAVVHDPAVTASHGPLNGQLLRDDAFTLTALESTLRQHYPVVHVASHFVFQAGSAGESYLLLGGKEAGDKGYQADHVATTDRPAAQLPRHYGCSLFPPAALPRPIPTKMAARSIPSGMVMQKRDAAAVLATLWEVNDASTSLLMSDFYRRWATTPGIQKDRSPPPGPDRHAARYNFPIERHGPRFPCDYIPGH
jgi:hypothetical protein